MNPRPDAPTPMMAQYLEIKAVNPDSLLFYRMGDFYELFFDDAEIASRALGIVLTKRGKHLGDDIPMCGVPVERADDYLHRLIALGHRVAVCEQMEDPAEAKKRGAKSVVKRDVVRLVTPGTITEERLLEPGRANALLAIQRVKVEGRLIYGLASVDISTGAVTLGETDETGLAPEIARAEPRELVAPQSLFDDPGFARLIKETGTPATPMGRESGDAGEPERRVCAFYGVETLDGFGAFSRAEVAACALALAYVERTQLANRPDLAPPARRARSAHMEIDAATRANLELTRTLAGERRGSLLATVDFTKTPAGARLLAERLASPLTDPDAIAERLDAVEWLAGEGGLRAALRGLLGAAPDFLRALARLAVERGGPRDLAALRDGWRIAAQAAALLESAADAPAEVTRAYASLAKSAGPLGRDIDAALAEELPLDKRDGGFVRAGFSAELDEALGLRDASRRVIADMQARYAEETGVRQLRIKHNNFLGFYIEAPQAAGEALLKGHAQTFIHRQTMQGAMRFTTHALIDLETRIASAASQALKLELEVFEALKRAALEAAETLRGLGQALAVLDVSAALGELAVKRDWTRPVVDASLTFRIEGGRHPVVEAALAEAGEPFVANDCDLSGTSAEGGRIAVVTGPNMAGKSTYLRQNALIAALAQMGSLRSRQTGADRRGRPAVQPRRRGGRSRARALDLHGRDGRDGGDPQSGDVPQPRHPRRDRARHGDLRRPLDRAGLRRAAQRRQPLPHPVRHPFPRTDAAGARDAAADQPDDPGQRASRAVGVLARGRARRGGSLLWRAGGAAGGAAGGGGEAGEGAAQRVGGGGHGDGAAAVLACRAGGGNRAGFLARDAGGAGPGRAQPARGAGDAV